MRNSRTWLRALPLALFAAESASAAPHQWIATVSRPPGITKRIAALDWKELRVNFASSLPGGQGTLKEPIVHLDGNLALKDWALIFQGRRYLKPKGGFHYELPLKARVTRLDLLAIGPRGEQIREVAVISVSESEWKEIAAEKSGQGARFRTSAGLGFTYVAYRETPFVPSLTQLGLTAKLNAAYTLIPSKVDLAGNAFITAVPLSRSPSTLPSARFYGINARVGYRLPFSGPRLVWNALLGVYLWGMMVPGSQYGISNLAGPQVFVTAALPRDGRRGNLSFYLKFAPLASRPGQLAVSDAEIAAGSSYELTPAGAPRVWSATLDLSTMSARSANQGNSMGLKTASIGVQTEL